MTTVKWHHNNMAGAPQLANSFGELTGLLDACLVNGFNLQAVQTITRVGQTATATFASAHGYQVDQIIQIDGCTQTQYNGQFRVLTITAQTLTYTVAGEPATPATTATSIAARTPGLGFEIVHSGTNRRAYRSRNPQSSGLLLRVDDGQAAGYGAAWAKRGKVLMAQSMSDIDTFTGPYAPFEPSEPMRGIVPTGSGATYRDGWFKWFYSAEYPFAISAWESSTAPAGIKSWSLVGDDRGFYLALSPMAGTGHTIHAFTDFESYRPADAFAAVLMARDFWRNAASGAAADAFREGVGSAPHRSAATDRTQNAEGKVLLRDHSQLGAPAAVRMVSLGTRSDSATVISGINTGVGWPNPADMGLLLHPVYLQQATDGTMRGRLPGVRFVHNNGSNLMNRQIVQGVAGEPGRSFMVLRQTESAQAVNSPDNTLLAFDITGPWY